MKVIFLLSIAFIWFGYETLAQNEITFYLTKKYYECKNLVMSYAVFGDPLQKNYFPNLTVPNNIINDLYYKERKFDNMTLEQGLDIMREIYLELHKCEPSEPCHCIKSAFRYFDANRAVLFVNETMYAQTKQIVAVFVESIKNFKIPLEEREDLTPVNPFSFRTLLKFALNSDFTNYRYWMYYANVTMCLFMTEIEVNR